MSSAYDISTAQSLHAIGEQSATLSYDEIERRMIAEGVDAGRARWLVRRHRITRRLESVRRIGLVLMIVGGLATIAIFILALIDSPAAPPWIHAFIPTYVMLLGAMLALARGFYAGFMRLDVIPLQALPSLLATTPRKVIDTGTARRFATDFLPVFLIMALTMQLDIVYPTARKWGALRKRGTETTGAVIDLREIHTGRTTLCLLRYRFTTASGEVVESSSSVSRSNVPGRKIQIQYFVCTWSLSRSSLK